MSGIKTLRLRIKSIKSTQKITKAMQMVAASKLRRAKEVMEDNAPYYSTIALALNQTPKSTDNFSPLQKLAFNFNSHPGIQNIHPALNTVSRATPGIPSQCRHDQEVEPVLQNKLQKTLAIIITSERGLCGGFNQSVLRAARADIDRMKAEGVSVKMIVIGKKGVPMMSGRYNNDVMLKHPNPPRIEFSLARSLSDKVLEILEKEGFDSCKIYFSQFKNAVVQVPTGKFIIPLLEKDETPYAEIYECEGEELTDTLIKMYMTAEIYKALLESRASEEAARMVAMDNATKNASEMIDKLTLVMNRTRQAAITKELIEIISGAEAI